MNKSSCSLGRKSYAAVERETSEPAHVGFRKSVTARRAQSSKRVRACMHGRFCQPVFDIMVKDYRLFGSGTRTTSLVRRTCFLVLCSAKCNSVQ